MAGRGRWGDNSAVPSVDQAGGTRGWRMCSQEPKEEMGKQGRCQFCGLRVLAEQKPCSVPSPLPTAMLSLGWYIPEEEPAALQERLFFFFFYFLPTFFIFTIIRLSVISNLVASIDGEIFGMNGLLWLFKKKKGGKCERKSYLAKS